MLGIENHHQSNIFKMTPSTVILTFNVFYQEMRWDKHKSGQKRSPATKQIQNIDN